MPIRTRIIRIGNSQGVRIPKPLLEQTGLEGDVVLDVDANRIVIHAIAEPRSGWGAAFEAMAENDDDQLLDSEIPPTVWDDEEWEWG